jgi:hypothetical protein
VKSSDYKACHIYHQLLVYFTKLSTGNWVVEWNVHLNPLKHSGYLHAPPTLIFSNCLPSTPLARLCSTASPICSLARTLLSPSPIGPASPTSSYILTYFFARGLLIALMMEAVNTSETWGQCPPDYTVQHLRRQPCSVDVKLKNRGQNYFVLREHKYSDDGGSKLLWNIGQYLSDYTMQNRRRQPFSYLSSWVPEISPTHLLCVQVRKIWKTSWGLSCLPWCGGSYGRQTIRHFRALVSRHPQSRRNSRLFAQRTPQVSSEMHQSQSVLSSTLYIERMEGISCGYEIKIL